MDLVFMLIVLGLGAVTALVAVAFDRLSRRGGQP